MAADILAARPVVVAPPPYSWTGVYVGVNAGYGRSNSELDLSGAPVLCTITLRGCLPATGPVAAIASAAAIPAVFSTHPTGDMVGGQIGFNYQTGPWVMGLEADFAWTSIKGSDTQTGLALVGLGPPFPALSISSAATAEQRLNNFGTIRGRLGLLPLDPLLVYATGGLAFGHMKSDMTLTEVCNPNPATCFSSAGLLFTPVTASVSKTGIGWTVGGGLEYAFAPGWSVRGEYLYYNLGSTYALTSFTSAQAKAPLSRLCCSHHRRQISRAASFAAG